MINFFKRVLSLLPWIASSAIADSQQINSDNLEDSFWQEVYDERTKYYEDNIGEFPNDILKMANMIGVWPGGGLYVLPAKKIDEKLWAYSTFGLSNPDMPATTMMTNVETEHNEYGHVSEVSGKIQNKEVVDTGKGLAGYGYEMLVVTNENVEWPLWVLQWAVNAEITNDVGFLERVEKYKGLTVGDIPVSDDGDSVNIFIEKAKAPLPVGTQLKNGSMTLLVATVIHDEELAWSMNNSREELFEKLLQSNNKQISIKNRNSIISNK